MWVFVYVVVASSLLVCVCCVGSFVFGESGGHWLSMGVGVKSCGVAVALCMWAGGFGCLCMWLF